VNKFRGKEFIPRFDKYFILFPDSDRRNSVRVQEERVEREGWIANS